MDNLTREHRRNNMSHIKSADTKPELLVRKYLFSRGLRYRVCDKTLPGTPDIVLKKYKTVIFVNGCFWHCHKGCKYFVLPKSNQEYWIQKFKKNKKRDQENFEKLRDLGWNIIIVWECELKKEQRRQTLEKIYYEIVFGNYLYGFDLDHEYPMKKRTRNNMEKAIEDFYE